VSGRSQDVSVHPEAVITLLFKAREELAKQIQASKNGEIREELLPWPSVFDEDSWVKKGQYTRPLCVAEHELLKQHGRILPFEQYRNLLAKSQGQHFFVVLPNAVRAACLLCTVTCLLKATGKARCWSCVGAKSLTDSGGVLPAVAAAKPLVGAPLVAFNRRVRFRAWNNGLTPDCRACLELVKLHNPLCMLKQKEFDEYEKASGRSDARDTSNRGRRSA
jgi:hypothetical protein